MLRHRIDAGYPNLCAAALASVRKRCRSLSPDSQKVMAEDAVQEAILRALERCEQYDPNRPAVPWLMRFVVNVIRELARAPADRRVVTMTDIDREGSTWVLQELAGRDTESPSAELMGLLGKAMGELDEKHRRVIELSAIDRLSAEQVAAVMGLPTATAARVAKSRAIDRLQVIARRLQAGREGRD